jgi:hypothetical protein
MPHASLIRTPLGITLATVAVTIGGILFVLFVAIWILAMLLTGQFVSPGVIPLLGLLAVMYGSYRLAAERRVTALVAQFPQAFFLHAWVTPKQRGQLTAFAKDAGLSSRLSALGGRYALVATENWIRLYSGLGNPSVVLEIPIDRVVKVNFVARKAFLSSQSLLALDLTGGARTWSLELNAIYYRGITPLPIPTEFHAVELAAMSTATHPALTS